METQVNVGIEEGLKHDNCIFCDEIVSFPKQMLTDFIGTLSAEKLKELNEALKSLWQLNDENGNERNEQLGR